MRRPTPRTSSAWSTSPPSPPTRARCWARSRQAPRTASWTPRCVPLNYPSGDGGGSAVEFAIDPAKFHDAFAADLPASRPRCMAATQRPVAEAAFSEPSGRPPGSACPPGPPSPSADTAAGTDVIRSMAERAGANDHRARGLARDHDLPAPGRDRRDPEGAVRGPFTDVISAGVAYDATRAGSRPRPNGLADVRLRQDTSARCCQSPVAAKGGVVPRQARGTADSPKRRAHKLSISRCPGRTSSR
jgi:hypothetical protein